MYALTLTKFQICLSAITHEFSWPMTFQPNVRLSLLDTSSKFIERVHVSLEHFGQKSEKGTFLPWHRPNAGSGLTQTSAVDLQSEHHAPERDLSRIL